MRTIEELSAVIDAISARLAEVQLFLQDTTNFRIGRLAGSPKGQKK